ncbi:AMP-dependent synthetase/ligase [Myxococcota bacterium]
MPLSAKNLVELYQTACSVHAARRLFGTRSSDGWKWMRYEEFPGLVERCRAGLARLGVGPRDRVGLIASNRVEWAVVAYATYGLGAAIVPMYEAQAPAEWRFILNDSGSKVVVASAPAVPHVQELSDPLPVLTHVIGLDRPPDDPSSFAALCAGAPDAPSSQPQPDDVAGYIYTSGTMGQPKGVLLTHRNIVSNVRAALELFELGTETTLSFLPWTHAFGQTADLHAMLAAGAAIAINDDLERLLDNLADIRPTLICAVPRIFNRLHESVHRNVDQKPRLLQALFRSALETSRKKQGGQSVSAWEHLQLALADRLLFSRVRAKLGGRLRIVISGSAALGREVAEFVDALRIPIYEGYGLTEASPIVTANCPGGRRLGSVGRPLPGVRIVLDRNPDHRAPDLPEEQGEVLVYGENVMLGYHQRPEETAEAIMPDGALRTGDLGYLDEDGYLFLTGRAKEQFKLENGKYVVPVHIEERLKLSPFIAQAVVYGANRPHNVVLLVPDFQRVHEWIRTERVEAGDLVVDPRVRALFWQQVEKYTAELRSFERPKNLLVIAQDFTTENGMLTPSLKVKRTAVLARYGAQLEALYP